MKMIEINDKYNNDKVWIIKNYNGNYYMNQKIKNKIFYKKFQRTTKRYIQEILDVKL